MRPIIVHYTRRQVTNLHTIGISGKYSYLLIKQTFVIPLTCLNFTDSRWKTDKSPVTGIAIASDRYPQVIQVYDIMTKVSQMYPRVGSRVLVKLFLRTQPVEGI
jgi:hypothetical protein